MNDRWTYSTFYKQQLGSRVYCMMEVSHQLGTTQDPVATAMRTAYVMIVPRHLGTIQGAQEVVNMISRNHNNLTVKVMGWMK
jgi:hypothetical protein